MGYKKLMAEKVCCTPVPSLQIVGITVAILTEGRLIFQKNNGVSVSIVISFDLCSFKRTYLIADLEFDFIPYPAVLLADWFSLSRLQQHLREMQVVTCRHWKLIFT